MIIFAQILLITNATSDSIQSMRIVIFLLFLNLILPLVSYSQSSVKSNSQDSEITIFVVPSVIPIDWSNPSTLLRTTEICFIKSIFQKNHYIIGHSVARITSPLIPAPIYIAMSGKVMMEKPKLVLIKKVGLGALGATMKGQIESEKNIKKRLETYSKRNKVAYLKYKISELAVKRMLEFIAKYQTKTINGYAPSDLYNGATYPRYENEGSGCAAFGISLLDVAGILPNDSQEWRVSVKIPMDLIGGEFNNNKKIKLSSIFKTKNWYEGAGVKDIDFQIYNTYEPTLIYNWIKYTRNYNNTIYKPEEENGIPGLLLDMRNSNVVINEPIFLQRTDSDLFIKHYYKKIRSIIVRR